MSAPSPAESESAERRDVALPRARRSRRATSRRDWERSYMDRLRVTDVLVVVAAVACAQVVRFGRPDLEVPRAAFNYTVVSVALALTWIAFLAIFRTRSPRVLGGGAEEYRRLLSATFRLFGLVAIISLLFRFELARGYLAIALPVGLIGLLVSRWLFRKHVARGRRRGDYQTSVVIVGSHSSALSMARSFNRDGSAGYAVVGVCLPRTQPVTEDQLSVDGLEIPVLGNENDVLDAIEATGADTVAVTATDHIGHEGIRRMVWDLEKKNVDLVVAPGVVDVAGPRLHMRPVAGLPLIHVEKPQYNGASRFGKTAFDMVFAVVALVAVAPLFLLAAVLVKATSRGPVFYRSERMGLDGTPFQMIKFRSMVQDADARVSELLALNDSEGGVLFKMREDPRVTKVGRVMRRLSIDELPQFFNVLRREMSIVGPRPPLRREVETYDGDVRRRLLVKPGLTGLWQVSGRSDLSWEESVRLDLSYVENWSMTGDLLIVLKTLKAVVGSDGAY
ncbi:exopolysaccharide biosynthesis polyprenyl glycosylphosphotransferase [Rhodococcus sp. PvP016]|uniref:Exopolysaccharide biosynthesis polyprenyl glycosylphosphotransferase n=2 Tax=Mycobacteriales TaxID=85007 RepID=A0ABS2KZ22_9NOCA|nr:exopolysaccharide biosynthesis polyprenyl glycosylphosphotransferase [Rhodococcus corynebacterioides]MBP1115446.1 exopolysaccharide biosynthesis polyprenyl glycosylphosphotransferase [Rhodococcus sp. PvP016]